MSFSRFSPNLAHYFWYSFFFHLELPSSASSFHVCRRRSETQSLSSFGVARRVSKFPISFALISKTALPSTRHWAKQDGGPSGQRRWLMVMMPFKLVTAAPVVVVGEVVPVATDATGRNWCWWCWRTGWNKVATSCWPTTGTSCFSLCQKEKPRMWEKD